MKKALILLGLLALTACNTMAGAGQDLQSGGEAVTNSARKVQDDIH